MGEAAKVVEIGSGTARKDLYEVGEIPPLGHVPARMFAWAIRREREGEPDRRKGAGHPFGLKVVGALGAVIAAIPEAAALETAARSRTGRGRCARASPRAQPPRIGLPCGSA